MVTVAGILALDLTVVLVIWAAMTADAGMTKAAAVVEVTAGTMVVVTAVTADAARCSGF